MALYRSLLLAFFGAALVNASNATNGTTDEKKDDKKTDDDKKTEDAGIAATTLDGTKHAVTFSQTVTSTCGAAAKTADFKAWAEKAADAHVAGFATVGAPTAADITAQSWETKNNNGTCESTVKMEVVVKDLESAKNLKCLLGTSGFDAVALPLVKAVAAPEGVTVTALATKASAIKVTDKDGEVKADKLTCPEAADTTSNAVRNTVVGLIVLVASALF